MAFVIPSLNTNSFAIENLRKVYLKAIDNATINDSILQYLEKMPQKTPIIVAYQGACEALQAKHSYNPYKKIEYLKKAQKTLSFAIQQAPTNIEIRYLRFSILHNCPSFLGNTQHLEQDRLAIMTHINDQENKNIDKVTLHLIINFLLKSKRCTPKETEILSAILQTN
jgi:hypothetical protein